MGKQNGRGSRVFVGREHELSQLHDQLVLAINDVKPQLVFVRGDYGMGKTALVEHFLAEATTRYPSLMIGKGRCAMETETSGLIPFSQLLTSLADEGKRWKILRDDLWEFTKNVAPAWLDVVTAGVASATVNTIEESAKLIKSRQKGLPLENVFVQFVNAIEELTKRSPAVFFLDDLQWADQSSLRLLFHLASNLADRAVLIIGTYRPFEAMETGRNAPLFREVRANLLRIGAIEVELQKGIDVATYISQQYPYNNFSSHWVKQVQEKTDGHPLFVSQIFSWWEETGLIVSKAISREKVVWELIREPEEITELPSTLSAILDERIKRMSEQLQNILKHASVEGEDFSAQTVAKLLELDELQAIEDIETIERKYQLVQGPESKEVGMAIFDFYRFAHRFFREYIYGQQLSSAHRRILHRRVGECLEQLYPDPKPIADQLARHFREANIRLKAARYALMAAQVEQSRYAWTEGEGWCRFGLEMIEQLPEDDEVKLLRLDLLEQSGQGYYYTGDYRQADRQYRDAIELAQQLKVDAEYIGRLCARMADICDERDEYEEGMRFVEQGKAILNEHTLPLGEVHLELVAMEGLLHSRFFQNERAIQLAHQVLADAEKLPRTARSKHIRVDTYCNLAIALGNLNRYSESIAAYKKAIEMADRIGDKYMLAICLSNMSDDYIRMGEIDEAESTVSRSLEVARQIGDQSLRDQSLRYRGRIFLLRGEPHKAIPDLQEAITTAQKAGAVFGIYRGYADLALAYLALSNLETAYHRAMQSLTHAGDNDRWRAYAFDVLGQVEAARQQWDPAKEHFELSIALGQEGDDRQSVARTQCHYAAALLRKGEREEAIELLHTALTTFQELDLADEVAEVQRLLELSKAA